MSKFTKIEHNIHCSSHRYVMFNYVQLSQWWNLCIVVNLPWYSLSMWMIMSYVKPCRKYFWSRISSGASVNCGSCSISWMDCGHMSSKQQTWKLGTAKGYWRPLSRWPCLNNIGNSQFVMRMVECSSISGWYWSTRPLEWDKTPEANEREGRPTTVNKVDCSVEWGTQQPQSVESTAIISTNPWACMYSLPLLPSIYH